MGQAATHGGSYCGENVVFGIHRIAIGTCWIRFEMRTCIVTGLPLL